MTTFNYQKAYCVQAVPAFNNLSSASRNAHVKLIPLVGELKQDKQLNIPMNEEIREILDGLETKELAELSRASYFIGHWCPSHLTPPFEGKKGESWKISNCCDQVIRKRLNPPHNIQIHEGKLRVTFSNKDCWLWEEFGLATEENLITFKTCGLPFDENGLHESAEKLNTLIGDLWGDVENMEDNNLYREYLKLEREHKRGKLIEQFEDKIKQLEQKKIDTQIEIDAFLWLNEKGYDGLNNCIYYSHTGNFCFGWREKLTDGEKIKLAVLLEDFPFNYEFK